MQKLACLRTKIKGNTDSEIPLLGIYPKKPKTLVNSIDYMHPYVYCSVIHNSQDLEAAQVSISRRVGKKAVVQLWSGGLVG